ncbi:DNA glycosylase [Suillus americanus]|nr:DNA glycosylase [Suillus americanus]
MSNRTRSTSLRKTSPTLKLEETVSEEDTSSRAKAKSPKKPKPIPQNLDTPHPAPLHWKEVYDSIKEMRAQTVAPVDTMGCEQAQHKEKDPKNRRFSTLVSLMLSSQTKDEVTDAAVEKLRAAVGGTLSVAAIISADDSTISDAIAKVGFWRRKTEYIKKTALRLRDDFDSEVPKTVDELCSLPGVGPKMAFLTLHVAWNLNHGIGVDVHVHRITNRLGWHQRPTKKPEETRLNIQSWLPIELHREINNMLVGFGQTICVPVGPKCDSCTLSTKGLCPSANTKPQRSLKKRKRQSSANLEHESGPKIDIAFES